MSDNELLPCPFCGGEAKYDNSEGHYYIFCDECGARTFGFNKEHAFNEWNKRAKYVNNVNNESNYLEKQDSSNSSEIPNSSKPIMIVANPDELKPLLTRSDIDKMVKLDWNQDYSDEWSAFVNSEQITIIKENVYEIYFEDYKIQTSITLEQAQALAKAWLINLVCSALGIEE